MSCTCEYLDNGKGGKIRTKTCDECKAKMVEQAEKQVLPREKQDLLMLLTSTDWKVIRHREQVELGFGTSLTEEEYGLLIQERAEARLRTNEIDLILSER